MPDSQPCRMNLATYCSAQHNRLARLYFGFRGDERQSWETGFAIVVWLELTADSLEIARRPALGLLPTCLNRRPNATVFVKVIRDGHLADRSRVDRGWRGVWLGLEQTSK